MRLAYGYGYIDSDDIGIENSRYSQIMTLKKKSYSCGRSIKVALDKPLGSKSFNELLDTIQPATVTIVVEDKTRKNPEYPEILNEIISRVKDRYESRIYLIIAYGTHNWHTEAESIRVYGRENLNRVELIHHDCNSKTDLIPVGKATEDDQLFVNKYAVQTDMLLV